MKRCLIAIMITGLVVGPVATAQAGKQERRERTVKGTYGPPFIPPVTGCKSLLGPWACLIVATRSTETFFTARVEDAHSQPVLVSYFGLPRIERHLLRRDDPAHRVHPRFQTGIPLRDRVAGPPGLSA